MKHYYYCVFSSFLDFKSSISETHKKFAKGCAYNKIELFIFYYLMEANSFASHFNL